MRVGIATDHGGFEVIEAYRYVMQHRHEPAVLVLSRLPLPTLVEPDHVVAAAKELVGRG